MKVISIIAMISALVLVIGVAAGFRYADKPEMEEVTYTVEIGDTLWGLAEDYCPNEMDPREWTYEVKKLNSINGCLIPGTEIKILKEVI